MPETPADWGRYWRGWSGDVMPLGLGTRDRESAGRAVRVLVFLSRQWIARNLPAEGGREIPRGGEPSCGKALRQNSGWTFRIEKRRSGNRDLIQKYRDTVDELIKIAV